MASTYIAFNISVLPYVLSQRWFLIILVASEACSNCTQWIAGVNI